MVGRPAGLTERDCVLRTNRSGFASQEALENPNAPA